MLVFLYKNRGETPLECLNRFKKDNPKYVKEKMTYAGRLDPLAEGLLLVLIGEECKNKEKYLGLDKEYVVDILLGFSTDSYDVLGKVVSVINDKNILNEISVKNIRKTIKGFVGMFNQKYPPFSSKTVDGIPLFIHSKQGSLDFDEIPSKMVEIKSIKYLGERNISKMKLEKFIKESIDLVSGDFRQKEIQKIWSKILLKAKFNKFPIFSIKVACTSGTYMRSLANSIGEKLEIPALAMNIMRTKIGKHTINKAK